MNVLIFPTTFETFPTLRIIELETIKNIHLLPSKVTVILV